MLTTITLLTIFDRQKGRGVIVWHILYMIMIFTDSVSAFDLIE